MRVLVTGASGFVGRSLLPTLQAAGHEAIPVRRGTEATTSLEWAVPQDLRQVFSAPDWPGVVDVVVHLAAANPERSGPSSGDERLLHAANVDGTVALASRAAREGVKLFVFLSTANVHSPSPDGNRVTEGSPILPQNAYARSKALAEIALAAELVGTGTRCIVLRPAPVFGVNGRGSIARLARLAATPIPLPFDGLNGRRSLIAVADLVAAIERAIVSPEIAAGVALLSGGTATLPEIVAALRQGTGRARAILPAPLGLLRIVADALGKRPQCDSLQQDFSMDTAQAARLLGWSAGQDLVSRLREFGASTTVRR